MRTVQGALGAISPPAGALFQVDDQPAVTWEHLLRVNPELTEDDTEIIRAMAPGAEHRFGKVLLRRTR